MKDIKEVMQKAERLAIKIKKKIKRNDLDFSVQVSVSSQDPGTVYYALQITPVAEGIAPMTFIDPDADKFIEKIEKQLENLDPTMVEKEYHKAQITHAERTITFHKERITEIDKENEEPKEEQDGQVNQ